MSLFIAFLLSLASAVFVLGLGLKIRQYASTPAPLKIPLAPAPKTRFGVVLRVAREALLFESLFTANLWLWGAAALFHGGLLLVLLRHLRYFMEPAPFWVAWLQPWAAVSALLMLVGLSGLLIRRLFVARVRYVSTPSDILHLLLLLTIGASGLSLLLFAHTDIIAVKVFMLTWLELDLAHLPPLPADAPLLLHLVLVAGLLTIFPFSKLLHAPGLFFSPTRNQVDNAREMRHRAPFTAPLEQAQP